jgi:hypothetical protein
VHLHRARARLELGEIAAAVHDAEAARTGTAHCPHGNRLMIAETATLMIARAGVRSDAAPAAAPVLDLATLKDMASRPAGPGRQMIYLHEALRLAIALNDASLIRASTLHLLALLDKIGAIANAPLRVEAELWLARTQDGDIDAIAPRMQSALTQIGGWPVGQRLARQWKQWREERDAARP